MTLVLPSALLLVLVAIEAFVLRVVQKKDVPWNEVVFNLNSGHTVLWLFRGLEIAVFHAVHSRFSLALVDDMHPVVQFAVAMVFWDFCFYWLHPRRERQRQQSPQHVPRRAGQRRRVLLGRRRGNRGVERG